jgi:hypothetical protein
MKSPSVCLACETRPAFRGLEMTSRRPKLIYPKNDLETAVESTASPPTGLPQLASLVAPETADSGNFFRRP